jgi:N-acetylneuraminate synthase
MPTSAPVLLTNRREPFLIAEVSCNHMMDFDVLQQTVEAAFDAHADAVKLQSSEPDCLTRNFDGSEFVVDAPGSPWHGTHLYNLYERTCTPIEWPWQMINDYRARAKVVFSTPFSPRMVDLLEANAGPELYKVSSIDWNHLELIARCLQTGKPVLVSLVKPSAQLPILRAHGFQAIVPMYCVSKYPSRPQDFNMDELRYLERECPEGFGFSDHSTTPALAALAVAHGATIVEKHFKLHDRIESDDAHFSATPSEFAELTRVCADVAAARHSRADQTTIPVGRSIYVDRPIKAGELIARDHVCVIRPGGGLDATQMDRVIGRRALVDLPRGLRLEAAHVSLAEDGTL